MPSWPGVFQSGSFLNVFLNESRGMSALKPSLSPCNSLFMLHIHSAFLVWSFCSYILLQNCWVSFASCCWFVLVYSPLTCRERERERKEGKWIFLQFGNWLKISWSILIHHQSSQNQMLIVSNESFLICQTSQLSHTLFNLIIIH